MTRSADNTINDVIFEPPSIQTNISLATLRGRFMVYRVTGLGPRVTGLPGYRVRAALNHELEGPV